ncbi:MAG: proprotein convertase P-domain-containing protein [Planctomycetota bacterium]
MCPSSRLELGRAVASCLLGFVVGLATPGSAWGEEMHSFLLRDTVHSVNPELAAAPPNTIFTYDDSLDLAVNASQRLVVALAGTGATVDAFSYGFDIGGFNDHSYFVFSISLTPDGRKQALPKTALDAEPSEEAEADLFWVKDSPTVSRAWASHLKAADENNASLVPASFRDVSKSLGLTGKYGSPTGVPSGVSNVTDIDLMPPMFASSDIYFSIDVPALGYHPADLLCLDAAGTISLFRSRASLSLSADDNIDGLALNIKGIGCPLGPVAWYSLTRDSGSLSVFSLSAADLFVFFPPSPQAPALPAQLHMTAESLGLMAVLGVQSADADIDSIAHIDPTGVGPISAQASPGGVVTSPARVGRGSYAVAISGFPAGSTTSSDQGTNPTPNLGSVGPGDSVTGAVRGRGGPGGSVEFYDSFRLELPSSVPGVSNLLASVLGDQVTLSWTLPQTYTGIEVWITGQGAPQLVAGNATGTVVTVEPGVHVFEVRGLAGTQRSAASFVTASAEPAPGQLAALAPPARLQVGVAANDATVSWFNPVDYLDVSVALDDVVLASTGPQSAGTTASTILSNLPNGLRRVSVRGVVDLAGQSTPTVATCAEAVVLVPFVGELIQSVPFPGGTPSGVTVTDDFVFVADQTGGTFRFERSALSATPVFLNSPVPPPAEITGLAVQGTQLFWLIQNQIWMTDLNGVAPTFLAPIQFPGLPGDAGDATFDDVGTLWVTDRLNGRFTRHDPFTGSPLPEQIGHPGGGGIVSAIAQRADGAFEVTHDDGNGQFYATATALNGAPIVGFPLAGIDPRGVAWVGNGQRGVPALFVADAAAGELLEIAAFAPLPPPELRDCHESSFGVLRADAATGASIPDLGALVEVATFVGTGIVAADVDVSLSLHHELPSDLQVMLESPAGTVVVLCDRPGGTYDTSGATFILDRRVDDGGQSGFNDAFGTRTPDGPGTLADFNGEPSDGSWTLTIVDREASNVGQLLSWQLSVCAPSLVPSPRFLRGDANSDGLVDISDPIAVLSSLFSSPPLVLVCADAADANDSGTMNIADAITLLSFLFQGSPSQFPLPFPTCGTDPTSDMLGCGLVVPCL